MHRVVVHARERERDRHRLVLVRQVREVVRDALLDLPEVVEAVVRVGHRVALVHEDLEVERGRVVVGGDDEVDEFLEGLFVGCLEMGIWSVGEMGGGEESRYLDVDDEDERGEVAERDAERVERRRAGHIPYFKRNNSTVSTLLLARHSSAKQVEIRTHSYACFTIRFVFSM